MNNEQEEIELLAWMKQGIHECFRDTRGARIFGSRAIVYASDNTTLQIVASNGKRWTVKIELKIEPAEKNT